MLRSASLFIGTSFTVAVFTKFATSNVDSILGIPHKIYSMQRILIHIKSRSLCWMCPSICTQGMQRTWWPEASTVIVTCGFELMHKAWRYIEEVPYYFLRSFIKFQGHTGWKINDLNPIWIRLQGCLQLSDPSDLPCLTFIHLRIV